MRQSGTLIRRLWLAAVLVCVPILFSLAWWLRHLSYSSDPLLYSYLQIAGTLLSFTYGANALVRFRGTHDRISLILAFGFILSGLIETFAAFGFYNLSAAGQTAQLRVPLSWMVGRTLLALVLLAAVLVDRRRPIARDAGREIVAASVIVGAVAYLTSAAYLGSPVEPTIRPTALLTRPWDLIPMGLFLAAAIGFRRRLRTSASALDRALCWAAWLNVACHVVASESAQLLDAPFTLAQALKISSYAVVLGGALLDNAALFDRVHRLAVTDPLTGLANYRTLLAALEAEIHRSRRMGRPFSVLLLDLDGLKTINDSHGHLVGSRAICRLANVLRLHCRSMDVAARYGGDEFAVILPEAGRRAAEKVARRICERLAADGEYPPISVSVGAGVFPQDGGTIEQLLGAADRALYGMKGRADGVMTLTRIAACL